MIFSWFPHKETAVSLFISDLVDPFLTRISAVVPNIGPIDISPLVAYFMLRLFYALSLVILEYIKIVVT